MLMDKMRKWQLQEAGVGSLFISVITYYLVMDSVKDWCAILISVASFFIWFFIFTRRI